MSSKIKSVSFALIMACGLFASAEALGAIGVFGTVQIEIDPGGPSGKLVENVPWHPGMMAGEAMDTAQTNGDLSFTANESQGLGRYITSIDGVAESASTGPWWLFCVNGVTSRVGMDHKALSDGDSVQWHYTSNFPPCATEAGQHPHQRP